MHLALYSWPLLYSPSLAICWRLKNASSRLNHKPVFDMNDGIGIFDRGTTRSQSYAHHSVQQWPVDSVMLNVDHMLSLQSNLSLETALSKRNISRQVTAHWGVSQTRLPETSFCSVTIMSVLLGWQLGLHHSFRFFHGYMGWNVTCVFHRHDLLISGG